MRHYLCLFNMAANAVRRICGAVCYPSAELAAVLSLLKHDRVPSIHDFRVYIAFANNVHRPGNIYSTYLSDIQPFSSIGEIEIGFLFHRERCRKETPLTTHSSPTEFGTDSSCSSVLSVAVSSPKEPTIVRCVRGELLFVFNHFVVARGFVE